MERRDFLVNSATLAGAAALGQNLGTSDVRLQHSTPTTGASVVPITDAERLARFDKARRLMIDKGIGALPLKQDSNMFHSAAVRRENNERASTVVMPVRGELAWLNACLQNARHHTLVNLSCAVRTR